MKEQQLHPHFLRERIHNAGSFQIAMWRFWSSFPDAKVFHLWILILVHIDHGVVSMYVSWWRQPRCLIWMEMIRYWSNKLHCLISLRYLCYVCDLFIHYWFYILEIITIIREITKNHWFTVSQQITKINK